MLRSRAVKRLFDVTLALAVLPVAAPLLAALGVAVRASMGAPVLFRQRRPGLHGRPFTIYKFRTMRSLYDAEGRPLPDAQRITRLGRFLRSTSLDELPELLNVLAGEMSLVGPRPLLMEYLERYTPAEARRHDVKPGITGWAQVSGRNAVSWEKKFELDLWYVDNESLALDAHIIVKTLFTVLLRDGIHAEGHATMPEFRGSPSPISE